MHRKLFILSWLLLVPASGRCADDQFFNANGVRIHYTVEGHGEPVVLLHGFAINSQFQWALPGITKALAKDYQVFSLDSRGHGWSGKPHDAKSYGMEMIEDVVRLLDHAHIKKAHVVGYSMGGFLALKLAAAYPDRLWSVTTGGAGWSERTDQRFMDALADSLEQGKGIGPLIRELTPAGRPKPTDDELKTLNTMAMAFCDAKALAAVVRSRKSLELREQELKSIHIPVLALVGDLDPFKPGVDAMNGRLVDLKTVVILGADHMNAFARPEFIKCLKEFLAQHRPSEKLTTGGGR